MQLPLSRGLVALVDDKDFARATAVGSWYADPSGCTFYARRNVWVDRDRCVTVKLHRFLTGWPLVDHVNGNGLDNRRSNLRPATPAENARNRAVRVDSRTGLKGVHRRPDGRFRARIQVGDTRVHLGVFDTATAAADAYDTAAIQAFGPFARLNLAEGVA